MEKADLILKGKVYFEHNPALQEMHVTSDGHWYYEAGHAIRHCNRHETKRFCITREEALGVKEDKPKTEKERLQDKAKDYELEGYESLSVAKLKTLIADHELALENRKKLEGEAMLLNLEFEELSDDELSALIEKTKEEAAEAKVKRERKEELEELGDERTEDEDKELEALIEELG